jgi:two-component system phosphate regulon sensor histidine kinase PhoR
VHVDVADSGIGIEAEEIKNIFDRFHRASDAVQGNAEGAGLGLYLASRIAELHGGAIEVTSRLGKGTKFVMILPQGDRNAAKDSAS